MRPGRPCKICSDPVLAAKVDSLRETGSSFREIAALTGANKYAVQRHCRHSGPQTETEAENRGELEHTEKRLESLASRLEQQYAAAVACGDNKVALDVTKVLARIETERHNRIVMRKQAEADDAESDPIKSGAPSPTFLDHVKNKVAQAYDKAVSSGTAVWCPFGCGKPVDPRIISTRIKAVQESYVQHNSAAN
jgi:hypothetical protein